MYRTSTGRSRNSSVGNRRRHRNWSPSPIVLPAEIERRFQNYKATTRHVNWVVNFLQSDRGNILLEILFFLCTLSVYTARVPSLLAYDIVAVLLFVQLGMQAIAMRSKARDVKLLRGFISLSVNLYMLTLEFYKPQDMDSILSTVVGYGPLISFNIYFIKRNLH